MKTLTLYLSIFLLFSRLPIEAQTFNLVGSSPTLTKANINSDVLLEIIQQKQEEVKRRVFRNTIIKQFNNSKSNEHLRNFTTYYFIYNMMDELVSGKNKKAMTKSMIANATEFAYVYGLAIYVQKKIEGNVGLGIMSNNVKLTADFIENAKMPSVISKSNSNDIKHRFTVESANPEAMARFNLILDLCLEVVRNSTDVKATDFQFKKDMSDQDFQEWYDSDNIYVKEFTEATKNNDAKKLTKLSEYKTLVETELKELLKIQTQTDESLKKINDFYKGLKKSNFKDFTLTKDQYYGMKFIVTKFLGLAKNHQDNNVLATIIDFFLENTIIEYQDNNEKVVLEERAGSNDKGYLYIDVEALISAIDQRFATDTKEGFSVYVRPLLKIGTNYVSFPNTNTLIMDENDIPKSLSSLYFASEKIGIEFKLINWKYTRSHAAGVAYKYFGGTKAWKRPQTVPLFSNLHINFYGSGLLYNIANLKSETKFNYPIIGSNIGLTFFNGLSASVGLGSPIIDKKVGGTNNFYTFSLDIPIAEYIAALRKK